ncbi:MAG: serine/threonine protein kinase, partial [Myxococcales bacterium]|nr:serine/threonine protein kinase [Myxococcales bacterium]
MARSSHGARLRVMEGQGREAAPIESMPTVDAGDARPLATPGAGDSVVLPRGAAIDRYVVLDRLGAGGMGVVYVAYDPELDRRVALKLLRAPKGRDEERARLLREAQAMARLQHPNVVAVHDVGVLDGRVWTAMELVEGVTLSRWLAAEPRAWRAALEVMSAVACGLAAAHRAGLVHRDVKPDNVMIGDDGRVRVVDFGLAREEGDVAGRRGRERPASDVASLSSGELRRSLLSSELTREGALIGTPAYMAPEQFVGGTGDARSDQYSWCVTTWEALFGARPFVGETLGELILAASAGRLRRPEQGRAPAWLVRVLERGLRPDPAERFASMEELLLALERGRGRGRRIAIAGGIVAVVVAIAATVGGRRLGEATTRSACVAEGRVIDGTWGASAKDDVERAFTATGREYAGPTASAASGYLDAYADAWGEAATATCLEDELEGSLDGGEAAAVRACLEERRLGLEALVRRFAEADDDTLERAVTAAASLPSIDPCRDPAFAARRYAAAGDEARVGALREALAEAQSLARAGKLERAAERFDALLPELGGAGVDELVIRGNLDAGAVSFNRGANEEAEVRFGAAVERALEVGADELAARGIISLVETHRALGRYDEASRWAALGRALLRRAGEADGLLAADLDLTVGDLQVLRGELDEGRALVERALATRRRILGDDHPEIATSLNALGIALEEGGDYRAAAATYAEARAAASRSLGEGHPMIAKIEENLGNIDWIRGELAAALVHHERALAIRVRAYGPAHASTGLSHLNIGNAHFSGGDLDAAEAAYERSLAISEAALGERNPRVAHALLNLGEVKLLRGDPKAARAVLERALALRIAAFGRDHSDVAFVINALAGVDKEEGDLEGAAARYAESLAIWSAHYDDAHPYLVYALVGLGEVASERGEHAQALVQLRRALAIAGRGVADDASTLAEPLIALGRAALAAGEREEAVDALE